MNPYLIDIIDITQTAQEQFFEGLCTPERVQTLMEKIYSLAHLAAEWEEEGD